MICFLTLALLVVASPRPASFQQTYTVECSTLRMGQYICPDPDYDLIDPKTQQPRGCTTENKAKAFCYSGIIQSLICQGQSPCCYRPVLTKQSRPQENSPESEGGPGRYFTCRAADGINCNETNNSTFKKDIPCKWTNGHSFETALLLSIFLGMFGVDRFYLGYPAIGLLKFCTLGFMFLGQLVDVILIATQVVGPADGSHYIIPYYGSNINIIKSDNWTYRLPQSDWA